MAVASHSTLMTLGLVPPIYHDIYYDEQLTRWYDVCGAGASGGNEAQEGANALQQEPEPPVRPPSHAESQGHLTLTSLKRFTQRWLANDCIEV